MSGGNSSADARATSFSSLCVPRHTPPALELTGGPRQGGPSRRYSVGASTTLGLGAGLTGCGGGIDKQPREEGFLPAFPFLSSAKPKSHGSWIRVARRSSRTPIGLGRSAPRFGGSGPCIMKAEQQCSFAFLDKWIHQ
jgi:hypothetical protein